MTIHRLSSPPSADLARALDEFEAPFTYPLGPGRFFRISHGHDYTLFFRAQGIGACFIAERNGRVIGALGTAVRRIWMPDGTERPAAYFGDLKIAATARGGLTLLRLARAADAWLRPKVAAGFGVVMGGTSLTPEAYTGRAGIPGFQEIGRLTVLRIRSCEAREGLPPAWLSNREDCLARYQQLSLGRYACPAGDGESRSEITPIWLMKPDGSACGMLEDTRRAKRLLVDDGSELLSAHLSCFAYESAAAGAELIQMALVAAIRLGLPALFVSVPEAAADELQGWLRNLEVLAAPATVYGAGLAPGAWNINSAEI